MTIIYIAVLFVLVFLTQTTMPMNSRAGQILGEFWGTALYLTCGAAVLLVFLLVTDPSGLAGLGGNPWYAYANGIVNILVVGLIMVLVPKVGVGIMFSCNTMGRFIVALIIDNFDLIGTGRIPVTISKILSVGLIIAGSLIFTFLNKDKGEEGEDLKGVVKDKLFFVYIAICIGIGAMQAVMDSINTLMGDAIGLVPSLLLYLGIGAVLALIISFIKDFKNINRFKGLSPIYTIPGIVNVVIVGIPVIMIPVLGVGLYTGIQFVSSMVSSLVMDHFGWFGMPVIRVKWARIVGTALMIIGVYGLS